MQKVVLLQIGGLTVRLMGKGSVDIELLPDGSVILRTQAEALYVAENGNGKAQAKAKAEAVAVKNGQAERKAERKAEGGQATEEKATERQLKRIYATARELGVDYHPIIAEKFGKTSSKELTKAEASELIDYLETLREFGNF